MNSNHVSQVLQLKKIQFEPDEIPPIPSESLAKQLPTPSTALQVFGILKGCQRCQRTSHQTHECSARRDASGNIISSKPLKKTKSLIGKALGPRKAKSQLKMQTQNCSKFEVGECVLGSLCNFKHIVGFDPRNSQLCIYYKKGGCLKENCEYSHELKDFPCVFFHFKGGCNRIDCLYSHGDITERQKKELFRQESAYEKDGKRSSINHGNGSLATVKRVKANEKDRIHAKENLPNN